ncbi:single-stranded-DNA-specific exonuclease RecJ [Longimicrobium sp.]|uniref:single-stranded-DNA-specific exonuclease RecJ n=1 Tax=Longimicrobium sp. TaxID=2029185 RepID=UPI002E34C3EF|nr:single-stranded-DNA-specific exonuclease RecJ [Longimicrobium sp.]HEX6040240.1 single-stranded-DNA-specific exonuclease RecJ [Longimicrobium sp.]
MSAVLAAARRWVFPAAPDHAAVDRLAGELRLPPTLCRLLVQRGYGQVQDARGFLRPTPQHIHPPAGLAGAAEAVARLALAIERRETVLVHGDYDVDGICATALYVRALRMMGAKAEPFVPRRLVDGYDLSDAGVRAAADMGATLILTCDCGIVAHEAVRRARAAGIDVVVTDHHTPGPDLPDAAAVVNPNRRDCGYPDKGLAGVGVAWKVCCALAAEVGFPQERLHSFLDLVAVATIADVAPLRGENRALVRWGLKVLRETPNAGLRALMRVTGLADKGEVTASQVGFVLAPRINAVGRMGEALRGVQLLLTDDDAEAERIAHTLEADNQWRRSVEGETLKEAMASLEIGYDPDRDYGLVLASAGWHPGVIGIVASRLVERLHRPVVMIALDENGEGKGSARSIHAFNLYEAMRDCSEHLVRFGGHKVAAGCSIRAENVDPFRDAFNALARERLTEEQLVPEVRIDLEMELRHADHELVRMLRHAGPFGMGNATPVFAVRGVAVADHRVVGSGHLKMTLGAYGSRLDAIGFGMGERSKEPGFGSQLLDVAFKLEENHFNGRTTVQAKLVDFRPAE